MADLTTLSRVKEYLRIADTSEDVILARWVTSESKAFEQRTSRIIASTAFQETQDGDGGTRLLLRHYPVASSPELTVQVDGVAIPKRPDASSAGWVLSDATLGILDLVGYEFTVGTQNVTVEYTAGYDPVPADVDECVIEMVALRRIDRDVRSVVLQSVAGEMVDFRGISGMVANIERTVDRYRRIRP
jgi:hypothetical protein